MICNGDPVFFLAGMPGKELKVEKKINRGVIRTGETDIKVHLIDSFPNYPYHVFDDEDMTELAASIEARTVYDWRSRDDIPVYGFFFNL